MWVDLQMLKTSCRGISRDTEPSLGTDPCFCHQVMMCSTNLEILRLSDNHVNEQGFCELLHGLQHSTSTLRELDLHDVPFNEFSNNLNVAHRLEISLAHHTSLRRLGLGHNKVESEGRIIVHALTRALQVNTTLTALSCRYNPQRLDEVSNHWGELVARNSTLQELDLCGPTLPFPTNELFFTALGSNSSLTKLDLSDQFFSATDFAVLRTSLDGNTTLKALILHKANLLLVTQNTIFWHLFSALGNSTNCITVLNLSRTAIGSEGFEEMCRCYLLRQPNPCLKDLNLRR
jgi:Ran GTPase-activating protein (RanGAP) involved in mRNA processing and transport